MDKTFPQIKVHKQAVFYKFGTWTNQVLRHMNWVSSIDLYLLLLIINQRAPLRRAPKNFIDNSLMFFPVVFLLCIIFLFNYLFQENNQVGAEMGESSDEELARAILPGLGGNALG